MLSAQVLAVTGQCKCEIQIEPPEGVVTASTFNINVVEKALSPEVIKSTDDYKSIYKMLLEVRDRTAEMVGKADLCSQKADEAAASAKLADDVVNCVPLANIADNLTTTTAQFVLSANQGKVLNDTKVDKVTGKGLSTEDFTSAYKTKLDGIDTNANKVVVVDNLLTPATDSALSANQGIVIAQLINANTQKLDSRAKIFYGSTAPTSPLANYIWMKDDGNLMIYDGTAWVEYSPVANANSIKVGSKTLDKMVFDSIIGVKMSDDCVQSTGKKAPFSIAQSGFVTSNEYGSLDSAGNIKILKSGFYAMSGIAYVSDGANQGNRTWHTSLWKNDIMIAENFGIAGSDTLGSSAYATVRCEVNDSLSLWVSPEATNLWRLSAAYTSLQVYPVCLD
jgi:hypothetical protein